MARKRKSKLTSQARNHKQNVKDRYAHAREDAQLLGLIPTVPEDALTSERVDPLTQGSQALPDIALKAIEGDRKGTWKVPDDEKPKLVDEMICIVQGFGDDAAPPVVKVMAFNALVKANQLQHEIDNPKESGGNTTVNVGGVAVNNVFGSIKDLIEKAREQEGVIDEPERGVPEIGEEEDRDVEEAHEDGSGKAAGGEVGK